MKRVDRILALKNLVRKKIMVLDGAMGTSIQNFNLSDADFGGPDLAGCNENLILTKPSVIASIHEAYLESGADIIETNTFGATPLVLAEYGLEAKNHEINVAAGNVAREAADKYSTPNSPRFVAGSMGPTTKAMSVTGGVTFDELTEHYYAQAKGLHEGGVDFFLIETVQDTRNAKAAVQAVLKLFQEGYEKIPMALSGTIEPMGTLLAGQSIDAFWSSLAHLDLLYMGLNCATGPEFMTDHLRTLAAVSSFPVASMPNAGLPDEDGLYLETPEMIAKTLERFIQAGWVQLVGGCCGTTPKHIEALSAMAKKYTPNVTPKRIMTHLSGIDFLDVTDDKRPLLVGERTNVIGSKKFKKLIDADLFEKAAEVARGQIKKGAQVIDVCLANPDRDELSDIKKFLEFAIKMIKAPLMIDSTDAEVIKLALTYSQGKALINSINLEDGEERFEKIVPLALQFGAGLVVGTIDEDPEQGMGVTRQRKLEIAERSYKLLTEKYGVKEEDIYWDALVFPCATGDKNYIGSAVETIEGIRLIKRKFPNTKTVLGISNVSFGLPTHGREILNSVFLYHCVQAGLDLAIVNTELLKRYPSIETRERELSENILWNRGADPVMDFKNYFSDKKPQIKKEKSTLTLDERLASYILEGTKDGLQEDLTLALRERKPLDIINGPLMKGMDEVGRLFNANELIVAEVLQSAEAMKEAVKILEPHMEKNATLSRGKVLLATVKGDVHDIGKNLVEIILSNNGFEVVNLGIKVPPEQLIAAVKEHKPHLIGLSGLLVKSAQQMVITAEDMNKAGIHIPMLVGGAALSRNFVDKKIAKAYGGFVEYASDAMNGLELAKILIDPEEFKVLENKALERRLKIEENSPTKPIENSSAPHVSSIVPDPSPPRAPDFERHVLTQTPIDEIWNYINPRMLYGRHLGVPNSLIESPKSERSEKINTIFETVEEVKLFCKTHQLLSPKAVYQFFKVTHTSRYFKFERQSKAPYLSIADYFNYDHPDENMAMFVVTAGQGVREKATEWKNEGQYLKSHILSALALETAEGYAEYLHQLIRRMWGFSENHTKLELFQSKYRGKRYSFGYPACPDLSMQKTLFDLLKPYDIGVELTDGFMMDPEASVSAVVSHHTEASYFSL